MKRIGLCLLVLPLLFGCASILKRPGIDEVKTMAIVSVYMNKDFYLVDAPKSQEGKFSLKGLLKGMVSDTIQKKMDKEGEEQQQIITYALKAFYQELDTIERWKLIPLDVSTEEYASLWDIDTGNALLDRLGNMFQQNEIDQWVVPNGMKYIPIESVISTRSGWKSNDTELKENLDSMGKMAQKLNVDAVAIVNLDMAYRYGKLWKLSVGKKTMAKPTISSGLVVVTKEGELAVNTGPALRGKDGDRSEGKSAGMISKGKFTLKHSKNKTVEVYCQALEKAAIKLREKIEKAFTKLK